MQVCIDKLSDVLYDCPHLETILTLCTNKIAYLVGGAIRDALLGRHLSDLDLIFPDDPTSLARAFARQVGGHWFWLDKERLQSRVVVMSNNYCLHYDFALFRAPDLENDLRDRDFTLNALALPLTGNLSATLLVDPCRGLDDLHQGSLRMVGKNSFSNDPLRVVRGIRLAAVLGLTIEPATLRAMHDEATNLKHVAPERIRQEVWKILADDHADRGLQLLHESGAGVQLFGGNLEGQLQELTGKLKSSRDLWRELGQREPVVREWLTDEIEQGLSNATLLLWTFLLHSINPELPVILAEKWRLSRKARINIAAVASLDKTALKDFAGIARNERAYAWWAANRKIEPKLLLLALSVVWAHEMGTDPVELQLWVPLVASLSDQRPNDLVDGRWLRDVLHLKDGPEMTKALKRLRKAEISGRVSSSVEAQWFLARHYQNKD